VTGDYANQDDEFTVTVTLEKPDGSPMTASDVDPRDIQGATFSIPTEGANVGKAVATFTMTGANIGDNAIVISGIREGFKYTVVQTDDPRYTTTGTVPTASVLDGNKDVKILNVSIAPVPSGIGKTNSILIPVFLGLLLMLGVLLSIIHRRRMAAKYNR
jgi:hypothetical protein